MSGIAAAEPLPQHLQALNRANEIRLANATARREIGRASMGHGFALLARLIEDLPGHTGQMRLHYAMRAPWRIGRHRATILLNEAGISNHRHDRRLGELTLGERSRIVAVLRRRSVQ